MDPSGLEAGAGIAGAFSESLESALAELSDVRRAMLAAEVSVASSEPGIHPEHAPGARNLAHYLALRAREMRPLQLRLMHLGLSSLGRCEAHALASVEAACSSR